MSSIVLNVDDHEPNRYARTRVLRAAGFDVIEAASGTETLDKARGYLPDLILLDVNLPDINGIEISRQLKSDPATKRIPIVQISAVSREESDQVAALERGADTYLTEPVAPDVLVANIHALLRLAHERDQDSAAAVEQVRRFEWLLGSHGGDGEEASEQPFGNLSGLNKSRVLLDAAGENALREIVQDYVGVLQTSCAVYEKTGDYALGIYDAGWCRILNAAARRLCQTPDDQIAMASGKWLCHEACWQASKRSIETGAPFDMECPGGHRIFAVPIIAGGETVGSINFGYGDPPTDPEKLAEISKAFDVPLEELGEQVRQFHSRPSAVVEAAKRRLLVSARLLGELVERKRAEDSAREARAEAERAMDRVLRLQNITAALVEAVTTEDVLDTIIGRVMAATGADTGLVVLVSEGGGDLIGARVRGYPPADTERFRRVRPDARLPVTEAIRTRAVVAARSVAEDTRYTDLPALPPPRNAGATAALPFLAHDRVLGALGLRFSEPRDFAPGDIDFLATVGRACAAALERAELYDSERRARTELQRSEERYRLLVEANPIGVALGAIAGPEYGRIRVANQALLDMLGYNREDLKAGRIRWTDVTPQEYLHLDEQAIAEAKRGERSRPFEKECVRNDGTRISIMVALALISELEAVVFVFDITKRKQQEEALRESEARLRFVAESSPDSIFIQDRELRYVWVGRPAATLTREQYLGRTDFDLMPPEDAKLLTGIKRRVIEDGRPITVELPLAINGEERVFDATYEPWRDGSGRVIGLGGYVRDITERKQIEKRLQEAQRLEGVGVLAAGIAHDFNNILTGILGSASLLAGDVPPAAAENVQRIISSSERAALLTRQLLAYAGKGRFVMADLNLSGIIHDMSDLLRMSVPKNVDLDFRLTERLPAVAADPSQMQQLMMNLVVNGAEAIPERRSGRVTVRTGLEKLTAPLTDATGQEIRPGEYVAVTVTDTGAGIDDQIKARMFDPFYTTKFTGRGLGLAAVAGIVRAEKGGILVDTAPGQGTTFRVLLPAGTVRRADIPKRPAVLVVDDEDPVRDFISTALERRGYEVLAAANGREGIDVWEKAHDRIKLLIVDVLMPVMNGGELLAEIRERQGSCKVLITSGYNERDAMRLCGSCDADGFLQKPYTAQQLAEKVSEVLGGDIQERAA